MSKMVIEYQKILLSQGEFEFFKSQIPLLIDMYMDKDSITMSQLEILRLLKKLGFSKEDIIELKIREVEKNE